MSIIKSCCKVVELVYDYNLYWGGGGGVVNGVGWMFTVKVFEEGWWGWRVIKESFQSHLTKRVNA